MTSLVAIVLQLKVKTAHQLLPWPVGQTPRRTRRPSILHPDQQLPQVGPDAQSCLTDPFTRLPAPAQTTKTLKALCRGFPRIWD